MITDQEKKKKKRTREVLGHSILKPAGSSQESCGCQQDNVRANFASSLKNLKSPQEGGNSLNRVAVDKLLNLVTL